jgi:hypothetical protein
MGLDHFQWQPGILELPVRAATQLAKLKMKVVAIRRIRNFGPVEIGTYELKSDPPKSVNFDMVSALYKLWRLPSNCQVTTVEFQDVLKSL